MVHEAGAALHCVNAPYELRLSRYQALPGNEDLEALPPLKIVQNMSFYRRLNSPEKNPFY